MYKKLHHSVKKMVHHAHAAAKKTATHPLTKRLVRFFKGFTLIEVIIAVGLVGILTGITIAAIKPPQVFYNAQKSGAILQVRKLADAIDKCSVDKGTVASKGVCYPAVPPESYVEISKSGFDVCALILGNYLNEQQINDQLRSGFGDKVTKAMCASNANYYTGYFIKFADANKRAFEVVSYINNPDIGTEAIKYINKTTDATITSIGCVPLPGGVGFSGGCNPVAATPTPLWTRQFGTAGADQGYDTVQDSVGNIYTTGFVTGALPGKTQVGLQDAFIRKYDVSGTEIWTKQIGTAGNDSILDIKVDATNNVYVSGFTDGSFGSFTNAGGNDAFIQKYDSYGTLVWTQQFGTTLADANNGLIINASGVYVVGSTSGTLPGKTSLGSQDAFIRKYDFAGNEVWTTQFGTAASDSAFDVAVGQANELYVSGFTQGSFPTFTLSGTQDAYIRRFDTTGTEVWTRQFGTVGVDVAGSLVTDSSGSVVVSGFVTGALPGKTQVGGQDAFVREYDSSGTELWTQQFGTTGTDTGGSLAIDSSNSIYSAGYVTGTLPGQTGFGNADGYIRKFDSSGVTQWTKQLGTSTFDYAYDVIASNGFVYTSGYTSAALPTQTLIGGQDAFLCKLDASTGAGCDSSVTTAAVNTNALWTRQFGTSGDDQAIGLYTDVNGFTYVGGRVGLALTGQTNAGGQDMFLRKYDSSGAEVWTKQSGSTGDDSILAIAVNGVNVYTVGLTTGSLNGLSNSGSSDAFIRKYDTSGTELWTREFGTTGDDQARSVAVDVSGNVYVSGYVTAALPGQTFAGGTYDAFLRKYDSAGTELWTREFGTSGFDQAYSTSFDNAGNVYVVGTVAGALSSQTWAGSNDAFIRKYDSAGTELWTRQFGTSSADLIYRVTVDSTNKIDVAGYANAALPGQTAFGDYDGFVRQYDSAGTELWTRQFGSNLADYPRAIITDSSNNIYIGGNTLGALPGQTAFGDYDDFVKKFDSNGNELWTKQFGTAGDDRAQNISIDNSGYIYNVGGVSAALPSQTYLGSFDAFICRMDGATGSGCDSTAPAPTPAPTLFTKQFGTSSADTARSVAVDDAGNTYTAGFITGTLPGETANGGWDAYVSKHDALGNILWNRQFGSGGDDGVRGIAERAGSVYVVGITSDVLPGQTSIGGQDAFIRKYDSAGTELWTRQFGTAGSDFATPIAIDNTGTVYMAGAVVGALPGQTAGTGTDSYIRKYDSNGNILFTKQFPYVGSDFPYELNLDSSGNIYMAGYAGGAWPGQTYTGANDAFVTKLTSNGNEIWTKEFGSVGNDVVYTSVPDALGNVYVAGYVAGALPGQTYAGGTFDAFVRKYDSAGTELWTRQFGTAAEEDITKLVLDNLGGIYTIGSVGAALPGKAHAGGYDGFIRKYDSSGNEVWTTQLGTAQHDQFMDVAIKANGVGGSVYVTGYVGGTVPYGNWSGGTNILICNVKTSDGSGCAITTPTAASTPLFTKQIGTAGNDTGAIWYDAPNNVYYASGYTDGAWNGQTNAGLTDMFIRKLDSNFNELWTRQFGTNTAEVGGGGATFDASGNTLVVGRTYGALPGQTNSGTAAYDAFIRKYDSSGTELWTKQFGLGDTYTTIIKGADFDSAGNVYAIGYNNGVWPTFTNAGSYDTFLKKFDSNGNELWTRQFGSTCIDEPGVLITDGSNVYVGGSLYGSVSCALPGQTSGGGTGDSFLRKYDSSGTELWTRQFGTAGIDYMNSATKDSSGNIILEGFTDNAWPTFTNAGSFDTYIKKFDPSGTEIFTKQWGSPGYDTSYGINIDSSGNLYATGITTGIMPGQTYFGGANDAFVTKFDSSGTELWTRQFGTAGADGVSTPRISGSYLYITRDTTGTFPGQTSSGLQDLYIRKFDLNGNSVY
jgi:prepilin-type N-terminal cleavage/methylation domain-containing protein